MSQLILSDDRTLSYEYDAEERITKVTDSVDGITEYTYDALGQLLTETVNGTLVNAMQYDNYGNIRMKNGVVYTYEDGPWKDKLISCGNAQIEYDDQGNPIKYRGHTLTLEKGRQLKSFDGFTYTYNANGIRTSKTVNRVKHTYTLDGVKILRETWGDNTLIPLYDNEDSVCGILYNDTPYYFLKNLQGDIIAITNQNGQTIAKYRYDAWGKCTVTSDTSGSNISGINPFRYRSYYYDPEISIYYLQSRYYDPGIGRFMNGDGPEMLLLETGTTVSNLYVYCDNSTVGRLDLYGYKACFVHLARVIAGIAGLASTFTAVGKAMPFFRKAMFGTLTWTIKVTGASGQFAACLTAIFSLVYMVLAIKSMYDLARVFFGTLKYLVQELKYGLNPWHKHKKSDLDGPDYKNPFKGW